MKHHRPRVPGFCAGVFCLAATAAAQTPAASPQSLPVLRSTTHLVQVNVIALDKSGKPVSDLTAGDFGLTDSGKPQKISIFSLERAAVAAPPHQLPPDTFSNRWEDHPGAPTSVTVILMDGVNTQLQDQAYARQQALEFFKQMQPQDRVALYALGDKDGLSLLHDFSSDPHSLESSLAAYRGSIPLELDTNASVQAASDAIATENQGRSALAIATQRAALQQQADFFISRRATRAMEAIAAIANYLQRLPGRKNLIWVSGGFPFSLDSISLPGPGGFRRDSGTIRADLERLARALNNANLAIYPVDARGLTGTDAMDATHQTVHLDAAGFVEGQSEIETMRDIADRTGGRAYYNTNALTDAMRQAIEDARITYVLGYYPVSTKWDGKFHKIKLEVKRPGVAVRYRRGYFALPEEAPSPQERQARLDAAVWSPLDATGLPLLAHATLRDQGGKRSLELEIHLDGRDFSFTPQGNRWKGELRVLLVQLNAEGRNLKGFSQTYTLNLSQESYQRLLREGFVIRNSQEISPGAEQVRVVVGDVPSEAMGSLSIPLAKAVARK